jgi:hypothetical protein
VREKTGNDNLAPPDIRREIERVRGRGPSLIGGTHLSSDAGTRAAWLGRIPFFFFSRISKGFYFYFLYGFQIKFKP